MKQRIEYIDNIKGFAILLVVMGHVIANWFPDFYDVLADKESKDLIVWRLIYSFHMPLFMFCSGLFQPVMNGESTGNDFWNVICRRFNVLMIPYFASGLLLWAVTGRPSFYWFLLILFEFIFINLCIGFLTSRFRKYGNYIEGAAFVLMYLTIHVITTRFSKYEILPLLDIGHLSHYIYFTLGYLVAKYKLLERIYYNHVYTLAIMVFVGLYVFFKLMDVKLSAGGVVIGPLMPLTAIYAIFFLFKSTGISRKTNFLNWCGTHSLEIYILHFFFLIKAPFIGDFIHDYSLIGGGRFIFVMGVLISVMMSLVNISFCYGVLLIITKSSILSQILLGRKHKI